MTNPDRTADKIPMSCDEAVQVLWAYLDRELDEVLRERVREHLAECAHCRQHYTFEGRFLETVSRVIDEPVDTAALRARIIAALHDRGYRAS